MTPDWDPLRAAVVEEPRALLIKQSPDEDFYIAWSESLEAPLWAGTREQAAAYGYTVERIERADRTGTSSQPFLDLECTRPWKPFYAWDDAQGPIAEQRGFLPRRYMRAYALLYLAGHVQAAFDLLEPLGDGEPVRRD